MSIDLAPLTHVPRLLFTVELRPLQGERFQPTGFPSLGAATYQTATGAKLLVESAQSMANRMEGTCWDFATDAPVAGLDGISHVTVKRKGAFLTDSMLEAHRLNSPYLLANSNRAFLDPFVESLRSNLGSSVIDDNEGLVNKGLLARSFLMFDVGSLIHGCFLSSNQVKVNKGDKKSQSLAGGRLRVSRVLSSFIEAVGVRVVASGGVKNDSVNPSGVTKDGFGNVPFARDEFTADRINCHINLDLSQIRGYGLSDKVDRLLILLALHRVRRLLDGDLRLRTACDLEPIDRASIQAEKPIGFALPGATDLESDVRVAIGECTGLMTQTEVAFDDELKKGKDDKPEADATEAADGNEDEGQNR